MKHDQAPAHYNGFDILRLLAAIMVLFGHSYPLSGQIGPGFLGNSVQTVGVKIFFVISGYLITKSWMSDPNPARFFKKRLLRIFPGFAVNILVVALILGPLVSSLAIKDYLASSGLILYFKNLLFFPIYSLPGVFVGNIYPNAVNGSLWSLPVEIFMYLTVPLMLQRGRGGNGASVFLVALSLAVIGLWYVRIRPPAVPSVIYGTGIQSVMDVAPYFLLGSLFNFIGISFLSKKWTTLGFFAFFAYSVNEYVIGEILLLLFLPYCVISLGLSEFKLVQRCLGRSDLSYGIYLYGFPVQQLLIDRFGKMSALQNFTYALPATALLALASWHLIERPALRMKDFRLFSRKLPIPLDSNEK